VPSRETGLIPMPEVAGKTDLGHAHLFHQELDELFRLVGLRLVLDAGVDILRVLPEDDHVGLVRFLDRGRHAFEVLHRAQADVKIEFLAQRHIQGTDAAADRRGQRTLDGHHVFTQGRQGFLGQPDVWAVHLGGLLPGIHLHPVDPALAAIGLGDRGIDHLEHHRRDVQPRAVALDIGNDGLVGNVERQVGVDGDLLARRGHFDVLVHGNGLRTGLERPPASGLDETLTILAAELFFRMAVNRLPDASVTEESFLEMGGKKP
jgi:hypothetical protein